jgi:hypothetical protein
MAARLKLVRSVHVTGAAGRVPSGRPATLDAADELVG